MCKYYRAVVFVTGNHEYYNQNIDIINQRYADLDELLPNFHFLNNSSVIIDDVKFVGGTMWTSLDSNDWFVCQYAKLHMNDFHCIKLFNEDKIEVRFGTDDCIRLHMAFRQYIKEELAKGFEKTVVVTHHSPCELSTAEKFKGMMMNALYCEDMTRHMFGETAPKLWCHGHMHNSVDYVVGETRVINNPRGYVGHELNTTFDATMSIEV
jgi:predicted phosphohydrolase